MAASCRRCSRASGCGPRTRRSGAWRRQRQETESAAQRLPRRRQLQRLSRRISPVGQETKTNMTTAIKPLTKRPAWKALAAHHKKTKSLHLRKLFAADPKRGTRLTTEAAGLFLDYSKNRVTDHTLKLLLQLAKESA